MTAQLILALAGTLAWPAVIITALILLRPPKRGNRQ